MNILVDTQLLIWSLYDESKLGPSAIYYMEQFENTLFYSVASIWEIAIKHHRKPEQVPVTPEELYNFCEQYDYFNLPIKASHVIATSYLKDPPESIRHKDPFDRLLLAQAKTEGMRLLTHDDKLAAYDEACVLLV